MDAHAMERLLRNIDRRTKAIEQILPTLATKKESKNLATKAELKKLATKTQLKKLATKAELKLLATKAELQAAIEPLATKEELRAVVREEGERSRRHMDIVAEAMRDQVRLLAEGHDWLATKVVDHDARITRLEDISDAS